MVGISFKCKLKFYVIVAFALNNKEILSCVGVKVIRIVPFLIINLLKKLRMKTLDVFKRGLIFKKFHKIIHFRVCIHFLTPLGLSCSTIFIVFGLCSFISTYRFLDLLTTDHRCWLINFTSDGMNLWFFDSMLVHWMLVQWWILMQFCWTSSWSIF